MLVKWILEYRQDRVYWSVNAGIEERRVLECFKGYVNDLGRS